MEMDNEEMQEFLWQSDPEHFWNLEEEVSLGIASLNQIFSHIDNWDNLTPIAVKVGQK